MLVLQRGDARVAVYFLTALVILSIFSSSVYAASVKVSKGIGPSNVFYPADLMLEKIGLALSSGEEKPARALEYATEHLAEAQQAVAERKSSSVISAVVASKERYEYASAHISGFSFSGSEEDRSKLESFTQVESQLALSHKELVELQESITGEVASGTLDSSTLAEVENLQSDHRILERSREDKELEFVTKASAIYGPVQAQLLIEKAEEASGAYSVFKEQTLSSVERAREDISYTEGVAQELEVKGGIETAAKIRLINQRALYFAQQSENSFAIGFYGEAHDASVEANRLASAAREIVAGKDVKLDSLISSPLQQLQDQQAMGAIYVQGYEDHKESLISKYPDDVSRIEKKIAIVTEAAKVAEQSEARYASDVIQLRNAGKTDEQIGAELSKQYGAQIRKAYGEIDSVRVASPRGKSRVRSVPVQSEDGSSSDTPSSSGSSSGQSDTGTSSGSSQPSASGSSSGSTKSSSSSGSSASASSAKASGGVREVSPSGESASVSGNIIRDNENEGSFIDTLRVWLRKQLGYSS